MTTHSFPIIGTVSDPASGICTSPPQKKKHSADSVINLATIAQLHRQCYTSGYILMRVLGECEKSCSSFVRPGKAEVTLSFFYIKERLRRVVHKQEVIWTDWSFAPMWSVFVYPEYFQYTMLILRVYWLQRSTLGKSFSMVRNFWKQFEEELQQKPASKTKSPFVIALCGKCTCGLLFGMRGEAVCCQNKEWAACQFAKTLGLAMRRIFLGEEGCRPLNGSCARICGTFGRLPVFPCVLALPCSSLSATQKPFP